MLVMCCTFSYAETVTLTSSLWANEVSGTNNSLPVIPSCARRVHIVNNVDSMPELATALTSAELIFSNAMQQENIDLININAEIRMGTDSIFADNEICKVAIEYSNSIVYNSNYNGFGDLSSPLPVIFPVAIANQTKDAPVDTAMHIYLNPEWSYYCGVEAAPQGKVDMITLLLRALTMGCGVQSSLKTETMQMGVMHNGILYVTPFDTQIYNDLGVTFAEVVAEEENIWNFLTNRSIYVDGYDDSYGIWDIAVKLFNDWETGYYPSLSSSTLNTIDSETYTLEEYNNDFYDLLDFNLIDNASIREVTRYSMALLRKLGWYKTIAVGYDDPFVPLYNSTLHCSSQTLLPNTSYTVSLSSTGPVTLSNVVCKLSSSDSTYVIGNVQSGNTFSYSSIPQNIQWQRNPVTKNIIGEMQGEASMYVNNYVSQQKSCYIEIPYKPNRPIIQKSEITDNGNIQLSLQAFANGSNTYTVTYKGVVNNDIHTFTVSEYALDTLLSNIPATQLYNATIYGTNNEGRSDSCKFTFGFSAHPTLTLRLVATRTYLIYDLSDNGLIDISDVVISSVKITDIFGNTVLTSNAGSGDIIPIASLPRGRYILTVVADGNTYSKPFIK